MQTFTLPKTVQGERLDHVLRVSLSSYSRTAIQRMITTGQITLDGKTVSSHTFLKGGEEVIVNDKATTKEDAASLKLPVVPVVKATKDYVVVEKPSGVVVHGGAGVKGPTMIDTIVAKYPEIAALPAEGRPGIVHRLDKDVSGLLVIARTLEMFTHLKEQFQTRTLKKSYIALVYGTPTSDFGTIDRPIARSSRRARMAARPRGQEGKDAITHWSILERFPNATLLAVDIETGRTHQIRAHLFSLGYPIVGDSLYKPRHISRALAFPRPFLHATRLAFQDLKGKECVFSSPLTPDLEAFLVKLRKSVLPTVSASL